MEKLTNRHLLFVIFASFKFIVVVIIIIIIIVYLLFSLSIKQVCLFHFMFIAFLVFTFRPFTTTLSPAVKPKISRQQ